MPLGDICNWDMDREKHSLSRIVALGGLLTFFLVKLSPGQKQRGTFSNGEIVLPLLNVTSYSWMLRI